MTRKETQEILEIIGNEYKDFLPKTIEKMKLKVDMWQMALGKYSFEQIQAKVAELICTHTYGTPSLAHLMTLLNPVMEKQNIGQEYAERFVYLLQRQGADNMELSIYQEYGETGLEIYINNKSEARNLLEADVSTFKAQIRNSFNSKYERQQKGQNVLGNKAGFMLDSKLKAIEVI